MKKNIQTAFVIILFFGISNCTNAQNSSKMTKEKEMTTVELTSFNLTEVVEEAKFIEAAKQMEQSFLNDQKGYIKRTLVKGENGWTDIVFWKNPESFHDALTKAESSEAVVPFLQMIKPESVKMSLSEIKVTTHE